MLNVYPHCREADGVDHCNVNKPVVPAGDAGAVFLSKRRLFLADHCRRAEKIGKGKGVFQQTLYDTIVDHLGQGPMTAVVQMKWRVKSGDESGRSKTPSQPAPQRLAFR